MLLQPSEAEPFLCARLWPVPFALRQPAFHAAGLGDQIFSKQYKTVSLETSGPPLTLEVFVPKTVLSSPVVLSIWQVN